MQRTIVVVGGGLAGAKGVEALREQGYAERLVLVGAEQHLPYERPALSKGYLAGDAGWDDLVVHDEAWYAEHDVEVVEAATVDHLDTRAREVGDDRGHRWTYVGVLLATGAAPRTGGLSGAQLDGVHLLRTVEDSDALRSVLGPGARVVLVGGGWIGLEVAAAARLAGAVVTVVVRGERPLGEVLGPQMADLFAGLHREHGVVLRTRTGVRELRGDHGRVRSVVLDDGSALDADVVVLGLGADPSTALAEQAGLAVERGVVVDAHLRSSAPGVAAAGDVARAWHPVLQRYLRVDHWANALHQPAIAAAALLGGDAVYDRLPYFYSDQYDLGMEYVGWVGPDGYDDLVVRGDVAGRELIAFWLRGGRVLAGMNVNVWDVVDDVIALIGAPGPVDRERLADPDVPLSEVGGPRH